MADTTEAQPSTSSTIDKPEDKKAVEDAESLLAQGKRNMLCGEITKAVQQLEESSRIMADKYGEVADQCGEVYLAYGSALLELSRMESGVLGNALKGSEFVENGSEEESAADSEEQVEDAEKVSEQEKEDISDKVIDAMLETEEEVKARLGEKPINGEKEEKEKKNEENKEKQAKEAEASDEKMDVDSEKIKEAADKPKENGVEKPDEIKADAEKEKEGEKKDESKEAKENGEVTENGKEEKKEDKPAAEEKKESEEKEEAKENGEKVDEDKKEVKKSDKEEDMETDQKKEDGEESGEQEEDDAAAEGEEGADSEALETEEEEKEGEEEGEADGEKKSDTSQDDVSNLQLAWEVLELAKVIFVRSEDKEMKLKAADAHLRLGEVGLETEQYETAIEDFKSCLKIQQDLLEPESRLIAETHYQIGLACGMACRYTEALDHYRLAVKTIECKIAKLKAQVEESEKSGKHKETGSFDESAIIAEKEMKDLSEILPDIRAKIDDTEDEMKSQEKVKEMVKESVAGVGPAQIFAAASESPKKAASEPAMDISHMIRKKRKQEDSEEDAPKKPRTEDEAPKAEDKKPEDDKTKEAAEDKKAGGDGPVTNGDAKPVNGTNGTTSPKKEAEVKTKTVEDVKKAAEEATA